ncbi:MAG: hypothetical protein A3B47_01740 [Candidatus Levybacteria bacterium RIFCSPLOWO2_01_FULL_39_24]|nr:MAG: hypothetical protein A2800_00335 [Candidatus Levybacteria bacterium RIFCSPHIGHO2_01_FULL_40_16]OGH27923.1 MAG: hypothetical protein A3E12_02260 [Candidatus Levybacteria bacterium RIFCSPHIGHO2_12_FULL_39_9]OGH46839.1 MAG: hypothetical protein A3B47_01740 [Candidatus Levybacteria bacterium RIFCSPLOWO2_01_FULL_39_24]
MTERHPNSFTKTVDGAGDWLIRNIDRTKAPRQMEIVLPKMSKEDICLTVGIIGILSLTAGYLDSGYMVSQIQGGQESEQYQQFVQLPRNRLDQLLTIGGLTAAIAGGIGKITKGENPLTA